MTLRAFKWMGSKSLHLDWLLPLLPATPRYCEPYGGSASVILNRLPSDIEFYNDIDGEVVNFFRVLRDDKDKLVEMLHLTPYAREEYNKSVETKGIDDAERARRFYVNIQQGFASIQGNNGWSRRVKQSNIPRTFAKNIEGLYEVADRLKNVYIENRDAIKLIGDTDVPDMLFYCDPPYLPDTRKGKLYKHEMQKIDYVRLADTINNVSGKVALSGYDHPTMDDMFPPGRWHKTTGPLRSLTSSRGQGNRREKEVLWTNYEPQKSLFD